MNKQRQYQALVEINAQSRILFAMSDELSVEPVHNLRNVTGDLVKELGYTQGEFQRDSVDRYLELLEIEKREEVYDSFKYKIGRKLLSRNVNIQMNKGRELTCEEWSTVTIKEIDLNSLNTSYLVSFKHPDNVIWMSEEEVTEHTKTTTEIIEAGYKNLNDYGNDYKVGALNENK